MWATPPLRLCLARVRTVPPDQLSAFTPASLRPHGRPSGKSAVCGLSRVLGNAVAEGPVFLLHLNKADENVLTSEAHALVQSVGDCFVEGFFDLDRPSCQWQKVVSFVRPFANDVAAARSGSRRLSYPVLIDREMRECGCQKRRRDLGAVRENNQVTNNLVGFHRVAFLEISVHRRRQP
jgi:hypothetical protein